MLFRSIGHLILYTIIGIVIIIADIYFTMTLFEAGWISTGSVIGIAVGVSLIGYAFTPFIKYRNASSVAKSQKQRLDNFLKLYDYGYEINFDDEYYESAVRLFRHK